MSLSQIGKIQYPMIDEQKYPQDTSEDREATTNSSQGVDSQEPSPSQVSESPTPEATETQEKTPPASTSETPAITEESEQAIATLEQEIATLKQQLEAQTEQAESFQTQYIRIAADFENVRKRHEKEREELEYRVKRDTISELLTAIDSFERARLQIKPANEGEMAIHKSYQGVYKQLVDGLKRIGVSAMRPEGEPFDPNLHEAVFREPTNEYPEGVVIEQLMRGYLLGDRVLRHAMVKVAVSQEGETAAGEVNNGGENGSEVAET
jgi:molecular chaperone GrpE